MATATHLTIDDFERLPQEQARNHELVDGELIPMSGNTGRHILIQDLLIVLLHPIVREQRLGRVLSQMEYDFNGNAHAPDVSFFGPAKKALFDLDRRVQRFVPDLAIEIASENDPLSSLVRKKERYRNCGTEEVWIVSREDRRVLVYSARGDRIFGADDELSSHLLPGFRLPVGRLFEAEDA
jgi:Uma2 family endonuclease